MDLLDTKNNFEYWGWKSFIFVHFLIKGKESNRKSSVDKKNNKYILRFQDYLHLPTFLVVKRETAEQLVADQYYVGDPVPVFIFSCLWGFFLISAWSRPTLCVLFLFESYHSRLSILVCGKNKLHTIDFILLMVSCSALLLVDYYLYSNFRLWIGCHRLR